MGNQAGAECICSNFSGRSIENCASGQVAAEGVLLSPRPHTSFANLILSNQFFHIGDLLLRTARVLASKRISMGVKVASVAPQSLEAETKGGLLSSTTPSIIISPPLGVDNQADYSRGADCKQKNFLGRVADILPGVRPAPGADLTSIGLPAAFNLPKSQVQCLSEQVYCCGQKLLEQCADETTAMDRFLAVVRWHLSLVRPTPFLKVPYNPILGETHHVTAGGLNMIAEQVSHHPPITAIYATNTTKKIEFFRSCKPVPRFWGNSVEVTIFGKETLTLGGHGENYEMTPPKLVFRFLPSTTSDWAGETVVRCPETNLEASLSFQPSSVLRSAKNKICGTIKNTSTGKILYTLSGCWDKTVMLENKETGKKTVLYDGSIALTNLNAPVLNDEKAVSPTESVVVWSKLTEALWNQDWEVARQAKLNVEDHQRALRKERSEAGEIWEPKYFTKTVDEEWEWALKGQPVPDGPVVC